MKRSETRIRTFLRLSSALIILGLIAEVTSLLWFHPLAFVVFVFLAAALVGIGMLTYLLSLVFVAAGPAENRDSSLEQ
jgi:hypothetical protein